MLPESQNSLREWLDDIGLTQAVFAEVAGLHESEVSRACRSMYVAQHRVDLMTALRTELTEMLQRPNTLVPNMRKAASIRAALENFRWMLKQETERVPALWPTAGQRANIGK